MPITLKQYSDHQNAGDVASAIVVSHIVGESLNVVGLEWRSGPNLLAIGSILEWADEQSLVWGSGFIREGSRLPAAPKAILAVRGELTRAELNSQGIACDPVLGDAGVFIPDIYPRGHVQWSAGLVPHYVDLDTPFVERARAAGLRVINPLSPFAIYISELAACERIISSSLHGLIFAHGYGIPAVWVQLSDRVVGNGLNFATTTRQSARAEMMFPCTAPTTLSHTLQRGATFLPDGSTQPPCGMRCSVGCRFARPRAPWRSPLQGVVGRTFSRYDFARATSRHQQG